MSYTKIRKEELYLQYTTWLLIVTKHGSLSTWNVRSLKPLVFLLMQWFEGHIKLSFFFAHLANTRRESRSTVKNIVSQLICFQSHAWTLLHEASPHPCAFFYSRVFPTPYFPNPNHENCFWNWKAITITSICWRSWLTWLNYSGHALKCVLEKSRFFKMTTQRSAKVSESLESGETSIAATHHIYPGTSADQTIRK